ncbi:flavodoxin family protein [Bacillus salitolerans]|uniref:Flavodoxin family protein n=1 Tax=Bacillus salitolerans TaxID=1437434 RepID=A0ABW4LXY3_9BACI
MVLLQGSSREDGNTEYLSNLVVKGLPYKEIKLRDFNVRPIIDQRHDEHGFDPVDDDYDEMITSVLEADLLIFATPIYWYGMSGHMKNFVDRWSQSLRDKRFDFKAEMSKKKAMVVLCGGDHPRVKGFPLIQQFQYIFDFVSMPFEDYVIGHARKPGDIKNDVDALQKARLLNEQLLKVEKM